jgi:hypothetical protein
LSKISNRVRRNENTCKGLDNLKDQLKNAEFHAGRGSKQLEGTKTVYYMRSGGEARVFYRDSKEEQRAVEILGESDKKQEKLVIKNIKKNYE